MSNQANALGAFGKFLGALTQLGFIIQLLELVYCSDELSLPSLSVINTWK